MKPLIPCILLLSLKSSSLFVTIEGLANFLILSSKYQLSFSSRTVKRRANSLSTSFLVPSAFSVPCEEMRQFLANYSLKIYIPVILFIKNIEATVIIIHRNQIIVYLGKDKSQIICSQWSYLLWCICYKPFLPYKKGYLYYGTQVLHHPVFLYIWFKHIIYDGVWKWNQIVLRGTCNHRNENKCSAKNLQWTNSWFRIGHLWWPFITSKQSTQLSTHRRTAYLDKNFEETSRWMQAHISCIAAKKIQHT